ncbi:DUF1904 domain-containing protein [Vibrio sp. S9_S30]|uniref:DUF1904 domain-containing protein n=1 Tax=Vibrio sp. S9_S30 TaxID=2720226 RepID=UPI00168112BE|nr:DUF1904 domain-containing protein [Vibrio sp. S9_S30]MBD1555738.1 DUF1904 domain-containing protein [Vibrio sp. S9_S30]
MPHLRFRAVEPQTVQLLSESLIEELQPLMNCPKEDFTFEYLYTTFFHSGNVDPAYPFIEVLWFNRGQEIQDKVALILTDQVRKAVGKEVDVAVIFTVLTENQYYDNGAHY